MVSWPVAAATAGSGRILGGRTIAVERRCYRGCRLIERRGGEPVMSWGAVLAALGRAAVAGVAPIGPIRR